MIYNSHMTKLLNNFDNFNEFHRGKKIYASKIIIYQLNLKIWIYKILLLLKISKTLNISSVLFLVTLN